MKSNTYIKLLIGILLFGAWAAFIVFKVPGTDDIINYIKLGIASLFGYHVADIRASAAPTDRQSGRALPGFLAVIGLGAILALAGCVTPPANQTPALQVQSTQLTYTQACAAWGAAFSTALQLRVAGKLNQAQIDQVTLLDSQVTPICTGPLPTDPTAATQQVTAAVTAMAILEVVHQETK